MPARNERSAVEDAVLVANAVVCGVCNQREWGACVVVTH